jgi:DNA repair protein RadA/Sms
MKLATQYVCQSCGGVHSKWSGKCDACLQWNTLVEETSAMPAKAQKRASSSARLNLVDLQGHTLDLPRWETHWREFDRVCGGGLVPGSVFLVGGDPGIGKSTLLLQIVARLGSTYRCAYISGEEAVDQVRLRAQRLGVGEAPIQLAAATHVYDIISALNVPNGPQVVVIDSIQTMVVESLESAPGTVAQVRASAHELIQVAKKRGIVLILVGHVTKEGAIAGPRVLEHMVDAVLYFEGERGHHFRILRGVKNRFGATDEIGVFEMTDQGLMEVSNPSALFLADRQGDVSGGAVFAGMEGSRPLLMEIQGLVAPSSLATPRRAVVGWDHNRLAMILAVLEARCGVALSGRDIYLNVAGGLKVTEPAADLAVAAALLSSWSGIPVPRQSILFGEIGLSGEIRPVSQMENRLKEAAKLGFDQAIIPPRRPSKGSQKRSENQREVSLPVHELNHLSQLVSFFRKSNKT